MTGFDFIDLSLNLYYCALVNVVLKIELVQFVGTIQSPYLLSSVFFQLMFIYLMKFNY